MQVLSVYCEEQDLLSSTGQANIILELSKVLQKVEIQNGVLVVCFELIFKRP